MMHGRGQLYWSNGDSCVGSWHYGQLKKGKIAYIWANGVKTVVDVNRQGEIHFTLNHKNNLELSYPHDDFREVYRGEVNDKGIPHGKGTLILKDGQTIEGDWKDGLSTTVE